MQYIPPDASVEISSESLHRKRRSVEGGIDLTKVDSEYCVVILPPPPTPAPTDPPGHWEVVVPVPSNDSVDLELSVSYAKCLFWDTLNETWSSNGCYVRFFTLTEDLVIN